MRRRVVGLYLLALSAAVFVGCSEKPPVDIPHSAIIVNLSSDVEGRRPLLRVDVTLQYAAATANSKTLGPKVAGAEAQAAILKGLSELDTAEVIAEDKNYAIESAIDLIKEALVEAGLPAPLDVKVTNFVIQG
ncbi:hypothetical protein FJZ36_01630 [Candidatus Poribacteria bacterium]|nr:hypothetical protein [Candidatus Poribacteria bacterium]